MKRFIIIALLILGFCYSGWAVPEALYVNPATLTNAPTVDAVSFVNQGTMEFNIVTVAANYNDGNAPADDENDYNPFPFTTKDTVNYTNVSTGVMEATSGFEFETFLSSGAVTSASSFVNDGIVAGVDYPTPPSVYTTTSGSTGVPLESQPVASQVWVFATNIFNDGSISVGDAGLLQMSGNTINTSQGRLTAGAVNTGSFGEDVTDTTGQLGLELNGGFYVNPPGVYDLFWGVTNGGTLDVEGFQIDPPNTTVVDVGVRGGGAEPLALPLNPDADFKSYVYQSFFDASNTYYDIVFVNTNFLNANGSANPNISASVGFSPGSFFAATNVTNAFAGTVVVQFALSVPDVVTGTTATNAIYLVDEGGVLNPLVDYVNAASANGYSRPNNFAITTTTPPEWPGLAENFAYTPDLIYAPNSYMNAMVTYEASEYGAQIGRDPSVVDGAFDFGFIPVTLPDPTTEPGRIELTANQLVLSNALLQAEGMVTINASNILGTPAGSDWGEINSQIGASSGALVISNFFPTNFTRLRGDIYAYSANWDNIFTNGVTNTFHIHVLVVDQNLEGSFPSAIRNLTLNGSTSINVEDPLYVINQATFNTKNLTISADAVFTQNASSFLQTNAPDLENFLVNSNGSFMVDNVFDIGLDQTKNQLSPVGRQYTISSVENLGQIQATAPLFQSAFFENDGGITTVDGGSMAIEAGTLNMGLFLTNQRNTMTVSGNLTLSANRIGVTNSSISTTGGLTLESSPDGQITDFISSSPTTANVLNNFWQVRGGFSLPVKPATGDLFGTEITTIAANTSIAHTIWAGRGVGGADGYTNVVDGFTNNVVIGKLVLSRQSAGAEIHFSGAGANNGLFVDYLELDPNSLSYSNYQTGLAIDPNLTIYFADANVNPEKLEAVYPNRLVWVTNFWGPNSTALVTNADVTGTERGVCAVNAAVADSLDPAVSYFPGTLNADNQPYPLNNPNPPHNFFYSNECPTVMISAENFSTPTENFVSGKNAFASVKGVYNGLFVATNNVSSTNSGFITFTLSSGGTYSGRLLMGPTNYSFSGSGTNKFGLSGAAKTVAKNGRQSLDVSLQLADTADGNPGGVTGYVSNEFWSSPLEGDLKPVYTSKITSPYAGHYTLILTNESTNTGPDGYSYGSVTVNNQGTLSVGGKLADGNSFSQAVPVSEEGYWPFYSYVGKGHDFLMGWISFDLNDVNVPSIIDTNVFWSKGVNPKDKYFPAGFTNTFGLDGSDYANPGKNSSGLGNLVDPEVVLIGDNLTFSNFPVAYNGKTSYSSTNLTLSINPAVGTFTGHLKLEQSGPSITLDGVVLQDEDGGFGFFLGTNGESGAVLLQSQSQ